MKDVLVTLWCIGLIAWVVVVLDARTQSRAADGRSGLMHVDRSTFWLAAGAIALYAFSALIEVVT